MFMEWRRKQEGSKLLGGHDQIVGAVIPVGDGGGLHWVAMEDRF